MALLVMRNGHMLKTPSDKLASDCVPQPCICTVNVSGECGYTVTGGTLESEGVYSLAQEEEISVEFPQYCGEDTCCEPRRVLDHIQVNGENVSTESSIALTCTDGCETWNVAAVYRDEMCKGTLSVSGAQCGYTVSGGCSDGEGGTCYDRGEAVSVTFPQVCPSDCIASPYVLNGVTTTGSTENCNLAYSASYTQRTFNCGSLINYLYANGLARVCVLSGMYNTYYWGNRALLTPMAQCTGMYQGCNLYWDQDFGPQKLVAFYNDGTGCHVGVSELEYTLTVGAPGFMGYMPVTLDKTERGCLWHVTYNCNTGLTWTKASGAQTRTVATWEVRCSIQNNCYTPQTQNYSQTITTTDWSGGASFSGWTTDGWPSC